MKRIFTVLLICLICLMVGCAALPEKAEDILGSSPEAQIVNGSNAGTVLATLATVMLGNDVITVDAAENYSMFLKTAENHLQNSSNKLVVCRKATNSTEQTLPDPCKTTVQQDITLAITVIFEVKKTLDAKQ